MMNFADKTKSRKSKASGFSLIEVMVAMVLLLTGVVAIAELVPAAASTNNGNRSDSAALVLAQRELNQMLSQALASTTFVDALGNVCNLGTSATPNAVVGSPVLLINNAPAIDFSAGRVAGYNFTYADPNDPTGTSYDVRWAVITGAGGGTIGFKRYILGARQVGGNNNAFIRPVTLDAMVGQ